MNGQDLAERLRRLEMREEAEQYIHRAGFLCDEGLYPPRELSLMWAEDGYYDTGRREYRGRKELYTFYDGQTAQYTIHFFTNIVLDPDSGSDLTRAHCSCFEAPVNRGVAQFGNYEHDIVIQTAGHETAWLTRTQRVVFCTRFEDGWRLEVDRSPSQNQADRGNE